MQMSKMPIQSKRGKENEKSHTSTPPFNLEAKHNLGPSFKKLVNDSFPKGHILHKIFNKNTLKLSYKCMPNMRKIISAHNSKILREEQVKEAAKEPQEHQEPQEPKEPAEQQVEAPKKRGRKPKKENTNCNCKAKGETCPLGGQCLTDKLVYRAKVEDQNGNKEYYTGLTANSFKKRLYGHNSDFKNRENDGTRLSTHVWNLKDSNLNFDIDWEIAARAEPYNPATKKCQLCLTEKYLIMFKPEGATLNLRSEMFATCRHRTKLLLQNT